MYKIFADNTLIYDSTVEDYEIGKGEITLETNKSGSFVFSVYPDHFYYDKFVKLKTVITVYKSGRIIFRGRILNDVTDNWNNKSITCEGELGFLQDSIIRPFGMSGPPQGFFKKIIKEHNSQVDEFKQFKEGTVTVVAPDDMINRSITEYESSLNNINKHLLQDTLGGYLDISHGADGTEEIPTLHYLADFTKVSSQLIEFGANLINYTKKVTTDNIATVIIPLGADVSEGVKLTIKDINDGKDYVCNDEAIALYGRIVKVVTWDDETVAENLKLKAEEYLKESFNQSVTIELTAIDLHLLDRSIESFKIGDYIRVRSVPHKFDSVMLCNKQVINLLKPENDRITLGYTYRTLTEKNSAIDASVSTIKKSVSIVTDKVTIINDRLSDLDEIAQNANGTAINVEKELSDVTGDLEVLAGIVTENARNIATNATNIATNATNIETNTKAIEDIIARLEILEGGS